MAHRNGDKQKNDGCLHSGCSDDRLTLMTDSTEPTRTKPAVEGEKHVWLAHLAASYGYLLFML